jgi:formate dehydrogenase subunit gamma
MASTRIRQSLVPRFAISERIAHWLLAAAFACRRLARLVGDLRAMDQRDRRWLRLAPRAYLTGAPLPRAGRFNAGQKVNARLVLLALTVLYVSGLGELARHVPALDPLRALAGLHGLAAFGAAVLVGFHVYLAVVHPATRPALRGMTLGSVDREWAEHHHADWIAALDARTGSTTTAEPPGRRRS